MSKDIILSVIIPIYNQSHRTEKIVTSILNSANKNFELILIDDGSTDDTPQICDNLANKDSRIKVFHKENGGVSSARNKGLDIAEGKYIYFCDSDDDVYTEVFDKGINLIQKIDSDVFIFDYLLKFLSNRPDSKSNFSFTSNQLLNKDYIVKNIISPLTLSTSTDFASLWHKFFKRSIVEENNIRFNEKLFKGEDWCFVLDFLDIANSAYYLPEILYDYYIDGSQIESKYKRLPGYHLLVSSKKKFILNEKYNLGAGSDKLAKIANELLGNIIFSYKNHCGKSEFSKMVKDEWSKKSAKILLNLKKDDCFRLEISRKMKLYSFFIKHNMMALLKLAIAIFK